MVKVIRLRGGIAGRCFHKVVERCIQGCFSPFSFSWLQFG